VLSESVKFFDRARLIGMIEEKIGIRIPIAKACTVAEKPGAIDGVKPRSSLKSAV